MPRVPKRLLLEVTPARITNMQIFSPEAVYSAYLISTNASRPRPGR